MPGGFPLGYNGVGSRKSEGADPTTSAATTVTCNASANTKGAYTQLVAATSFDACGIVVCAGRASVAGRYAIDIAIGGSGSEIVVASNLIVRCEFPAGAMAHYFIPINIPAGTRIAARAQSQNASSPTIKIAVQTLDGGFDDLGALGVMLDYGFVAASTKGTTIDPGGTSNTKGSWTQLVAATTYDMFALGVMIDGGGGGGGTMDGLIDIGVGAAASEVVLVPDIVMAQASAYWPSHIMIFRVSVPGGTRLSCRSQASINTVTQRNSTITVYGFH